MFSCISNCRSTKNKTPIRYQGFFFFPLSIVKDCFKNNITKCCSGQGNNSLMYILSVRIHFYTFFLESNLTMCPRGLNIIPFTLEILEAKMVNAVEQKGIKSQGPEKIVLQWKVSSNKHDISTKCCRRCLMFRTIQCSVC